MNRPPEPEYAYLPEELLEDILRETPSVAQDVRQVFLDLQRRRGELRGLLQSAGRLRRLQEELARSSPSVAAVDGGLAVQRTLGTDVILAVAVGVEGITQRETSWKGVQYLHYRRVIPHAGEDGHRLARGVMAALELRIAHDAPHDVVILDGSHLTPIIGLNSMLSLNNQLWTNEIADLLRRYDVVSSLRYVMVRPKVVAMVKYDASTELAEAWLGGAGRFPDDRAAMTLLLEPGEYTQPAQVGLIERTKALWGELHFTIDLPGFPDQGRVHQELTEAIALPRSHGIFITYFRPHEWSPAYRLEVKEETVSDPVILATLLTAVKEQVVSPEVREPYPQYLADVMAKSVSGGMGALMAAVYQELSREGAEPLIRMVSQSYRTER